MLIKLCASQLCFVLVLCLNLPWRLHAWIDYEDLELYDLVEAVNVNFYELLEVNQTVTTAEIKRSFRVLSLKYHPDKNKEADAEVKFRNLVSVADVLKNETKRKKYDQILVNGLPDWRSGVYYYRRVRKLGLLEMSVIVSIILTFGHYLCILAAFWEKNYEVSELLKKKQKRLSKQQIEEIKSEMLESIGVSYPRILYDNLIVKISKFIYTFVSCDLPELMTRCYENLKEYSKQSEEEENVQEEKIRPKRTKPKPVELPNFDDLYARIENKFLNTEKKEMDNTEAPSHNEKSLKNEWTETDIHLLIKLTKKFPGGIPQRWERIACAMARDLDDVVKKAKEIKSGSIKCSTGNNEFSPLKNECENEISESRAESPNDNIWSQEQQKLLEIALKKFPKGSDQRWENITLMVPGKSKEDCILRVKSLVELVKQRRQNNL